MRTLEGYIVPVAVTLVLHAALLAVLTMNWHSTREPLVKPAPRHVKARLVAQEKSSPKSAPKPAAQTPPQRPPEPPKPEPPKPKPEPPKPKPEPPKPKPEPPKPKPEPPKPKPQSKPQVKPEPPKPDPRVQEQARQREQKQREVEQRQRQQRERELALALAAEDALAEGGETSTYEDAIAEAIEDNWSRPPSARRDMQVVLRIQLIPTGEVVGVSVLKSSGDDAFDRSAVNAVNKAARFPEVADAPPQVFERRLRTLQLVFRPEDLRQ
ncbi:MAG: cell envelope integrity protein TolA [Pseudomonadales bacterium]|jgi:TonB family protein|nr:cell envelope integrity protein TolA [Pseudomonadales bacterium]MCP5336475.1 cell envelope integrity protein TolA [Pseudomonadales bacterium]